MEAKAKWFTEARFGMFIHFGLFSIPGRGEWVMNREDIPVNEYAKLAKKFNPDKFDADSICALAVKTGMKWCRRFSRTSFSTAETDCPATSPLRKGTFPLHPHGVPGRLA